MDENQIAAVIVDEAYKLHVRLGPGLLESVYTLLLAHGIEKRGLKVLRQVVIPIEYEGVRFEESFRADLIVEDKVIVELKSVERLDQVHYKQLLTYLRFSGKRLGLLINFGETLIRNGIHRMVNGL
jgi:GxxExxY protein